MIERFIERGVYRFQTTKSSVYWNQPAYEGGALIERAWIEIHLSGQGTRAATESMIGLLHNPEEVFILDVLRSGDRGRPWFERIIVQSSMIDVHGYKTLIEGGPDFLLYAVEGVKWGIRDVSGDPCLVLMPESEPSIVDAVAQKSSKSYAEVEMGEQLRRRLTYVFNDHLDDCAALYVDGRLVQYDDELRFGFQALDALGIPYIKRYCRHPDPAFDWPKTLAEAETTLRWSADDNGPEGVVKL